jgi:uncharacterized membrane protein
MLSKLLAVYLGSVVLAAAVPAAQKSDRRSTREVIVSCGGEGLIGKAAQGRHGVDEFSRIIDRERVRCEILKTKDPELSNYDCDKGACDLVRAIAQQTPK